MCDLVRATCLLRLDLLKGCVGLQSLGKCLSTSLTEGVPDSMHLCDIQKVARKTRENPNLMCLNNEY